MSDDEDLEPVRPRASGSGGQITPSQMAAALAAISGSQSPVSHTNTHTLFCRLEIQDVE